MSLPTVIIRIPTSTLDVDLDLPRPRKHRQSVFSMLWAFALVGAASATALAVDLPSPIVGATSGFPGSGDHNGNGLVTLQDFAGWAGCMLGPIPNSVIDGCEPFDFDADGDVDASDFGAFQLALTDCDELRTLPSHNCCEAGLAAGCSDPTIEACVCAQDAFCCGIGGWDSICVAEVDSFGCGTCDIEKDCDTNGIPDVCEACIPIEGCDGDADGDGVGDICDNCVSTSNLDQSDIDNDGVGDACDDCPDTPRGDPVGVDGCPPVCGNGILEAGEACDDAGSSATCNANCTVSICGDNIQNTAAGEECDDGNTAPADGCGANCLIEIAPSNDDCTTPLTVTDGETAFVNIAASTDGPDVPVFCSAYGETQLAADVWFDYTATCDGELLVSLCGSSFDTKLAVYAGVTCPPVLPEVCSDDDCGVGALDSRVTLQVLIGEDYLIRVGGFGGAQGDGTLTVRCGVDPCAPDAGTCFQANGTPGCEDADCCQTTCQLDAFCCDVQWDDFCAGEAQGLCTGSFEACAAGSGTCAAGNGTGGCDDIDCCNTVCTVDPFCCVDTWDAICADEAAAQCGLSCGAGQGSCFVANGSSGCETQACCLTICATDPFCCQTEWDQDCADSAGQICR